MNELVFIANNKVVTDSLTVAEVFGKRHDHVMRDIKNQMDKLEEAGEQDFNQSNFGEINYKDDKGRTYRKYNLTEDAFVMVAFSYVTANAMKMKVRFIKEFKRMREELSTRKQLPSNYKEALLALVEHVERNDRLNQQIENDLPKVLLANAVTADENAMLVGTVSKYLKQNGIDIGRDRFFQWLREHGYVMKTQRDKNTVTQKSLDLGIMQMDSIPYIHAPVKIPLHVKSLAA